MLHAVLGANVTGGTMDKPRSSRPSRNAESPGLSFDHFEKAVVDAYDERFGLVSTALDNNVLTNARDLADGHRISGSAPNG